MWRHYVYRHLKADTMEVFYVGKGTVRARKKSIDYERANARDSRNQRWRNVVGKHGLVVEIVASFATDKDCQDFEKLLIAEHGRLNLVNMTDGGDGHAGIVVSDELRAKRSVAASGKRSVAWINAIRLARKNGGNGGVVKHGDALPKSWIESISKGKLGDKTPWYGKPTPISMAVMNVFTWQVYQSVSAASKASGMKAGKLYSILDGHTKVNRTELVGI